MSGRGPSNGAADDRAGHGDGEGEGERAGGAERRIPGFVDATGGHRDVPDAEVVAHEASLPGDPADLEPDVERIHRPIFREPRDPEEGREPAPWWVWAVAAAALFWGGWYLGEHGGTFGPGTHEAVPSRPEEFVAEEAREAAGGAVADPLAAGRRLYAQHCRSCHQADGRGVPGTFPPLVGSEWVTGPEATVVRILLDGLQGPIQVAGQTYAGAMPAWGDVLQDEEIAAVATYIRRWDVNDASLVTPETVAGLRRERRASPWTADELKAAEAGAAAGAGVLPARAP